MYCISPQRATSLWIHVSVMHTHTHTRAHILSSAVTHMQTHISPPSFVPDAPTTCSNTVTPPKTPLPPTNIHTHIHTTHRSSFIFQFNDAWQFTINVIPGPLMGFRILCWMNNVCLIHSKYFRGLKIDVPFFPSHGKNSFVGITTDLMSQTNKIWM